MAHEINSGVASIFVHAGAGFHSRYNEKAHLEICEKAARAAMLLLKNGATAVDAVEMAIILLEDAEITNAGYGSNLTLHGTVECDATIVNHLGRSGAAGAVSQVKNPISLARTILDASSKPLSLQRVPPNFLAGPGATEYAYEQGLVVLPHDALISTAARERWNRWKQDLRAAESKEREQNPKKYQNEQRRAYFRRPMMVYPAHLLDSPSSTQDQLSLESPPPSSKRADMRPLPGTKGARGNSPVVSSPLSHSPIPPALVGVRDGEHGDDGKLTSDNDPYSAAENPTAHILSDSDVERPPFISSSITSNTMKGDIHDNSSDRCHSPDGDTTSEADTDQVSDTVGAIAIDIYGNIAAGSSSGGIGMKHRGRIGPAALVGVGTSIIPVDPTDPDETCVATVTSGTGEHIATTMAASTCASRIYYCQQKCEDGTYEEVTEDEAMRTMIASDFMDHPGVKGSLCHGAIGIMSVKKTVDGAFLYFGHNTDSFALASMSSKDKKPVCVMSRSSGNGSIAQGGRAYRVRKR